MRTTLTFLSLFLLTFCSSRRTEKQETNPNLVSNIQHSEKYERGIEALPFVISQDDTVNISEPMNVTAILNSKMYQELANYENLELSYTIFVNNKRNWDREAKIEPADTMNFELRFDTLSILSDSTYIWQFIATARFERDGKFFCDTTAIFDKKVFLRAE